MKVKTAYLLVRLAAWLDPEGDSVKPFARAVDKYLKEHYDATYGKNRKIKW